jgi:hypothetical protein
MTAQVLLTGHWYKQVIKRTQSYTECTQSFTKKEFDAPSY